MCCWSKVRNYVLPALEKHADQSLPGSWMMPPAFKSAVSIRWGWRAQYCGQVGKQDNLVE